MSGTIAEESQATLSAAAMYNEKLSIKMVI
jgi:hypothetical protein